MNMSLHYTFIFLIIFSLEGRICLNVGKATAHNIGQCFLAERFYVA